MKIIFPSSRQRQNQRGSAVIVVVILLGIMMMLVTANTVAVRSLQREVTLIEKKQMKHWGHQVPQNTAPISPPAHEPNPDH